jgi:hypothetical protein
MSSGGLVESKGSLALQGLYIHIQVSKRDKTAIISQVIFLVDGLELYILISFGIKGEISTLVRKPMTTQDG